MSRPAELPLGAATLLLLVGGIFVMPFCFLVHVWPASPPRAPA